MRVLLFLAGCGLLIAASAWLGFWLTGMLFSGPGYEAGSRQIGGFVGGFATGTMGFMAVASLSISYSKQLRIFFSPFGEMRE